MTPEDARPQLMVDTDHNPDDVRTFYELPQALIDRLRPAHDSRTVAQALADLLPCHPLGSTYCRDCGYPADKKQKVAEDGA